MKLFQRLWRRPKTDENKSLLKNDSLQIELNAIQDESRFNDIPDEIILMILFYFDIEFISNKISYVSKRFAQLSQDFTIFRALFNRDFPGIWPDLNSIQSSYKLFYKATRDQKQIQIFDPATQALLLMRGHDAAKLVKPKDLTIQTLLKAVGKRPLIKIFSHNQPQLDVIYNWLKLKMINRLFGAHYQLSLSVLCNQHAGFTHRFSKAIKQMPLTDVDRLMYLAVLLGYQQIILHLSTMRPDIDLKKTKDRLTYSEIALIEGNSQALDVLLEKGVLIPENSLHNSALAIKRHDQESLKVLWKHAK